jgi:Domain of unknown function (DUF4145)
MSKNVPPSTGETAYNCPHCSAFTTQFWYTLHAKRIDNEKPVPFVGTFDTSEVKNSSDMSNDDKNSLIAYLENVSAGLPFFAANDDYGHSLAVHNVHVSRCYNCKEFAVWVGKKLVYPSQKMGVLPNPDLPPDIKRDFEEARGIVDDSARGAAALLRLCIQKLCMHLGESGKNIDTDIASLVKKGLNPRVQKSLDIVRVIGNESVHPGVMDLKDDTATAMLLFELVNAIADQMISHPKTVDEMYGKLPEAKRKAIEQRDK